MRCPIKRLLLIFSFGAAFLSRGFASEVQGALAFVIAVPLASPTEVIADGKSIKPDGFESGSITSFIALPQQPFTFSARNGNFTSRPIEVTPSSTRSQIVVFYLGPPRKETDPQFREIETLVLPSFRGEAGFNQRVLLLGTASPTPFIINDTPVTLVPGKTSEAIRSSEVRVLTSDGRLVCKLSQGEGGDFLVVVFEDGNGGFKATSIRDQFLTFEPPNTE